GVLGEQDALTIRSEMNEGGVLFGDGVEQDYLPLPFGELATIRVASRCLRLLGKPAAPKVPKRGRRMGKAA
ncbi:MAG: hypothetical protein ACI9KE_002399, partial [Polyangiales bacterium]